MAGRERGMALVTVLFLLALLMALAVMLTEKVLHSMASLTRDCQRDRAFWAASAGIEWARRELALQFRASGQWQAQLAASTGGYVVPPAWTPVLNDVPVEIFLADNPDGDGDPTRDNDLRLMVLARARPANGPEVLIESLCGFTDADLLAAAARRRAAETGGELPEILAEPPGEYRIGP